MMDTSEQDFESVIERFLTGQSVSPKPVRPDSAAEGRSEYGSGDFTQYRSRKQEDYDRTSCLDAEILFDFIRASQAETWEKLKQQHGVHVKERFLKRLVSEIERRGTLDVLRKGVTDLGCYFHLAYFKPETALNEEHRRLYRSNVLSIIRQVHYSLKNENSIDVVLFLNGLPVFTAELKNPVKGQNVENAVWQYKKDRDPKEPLLKFGRCLAHFAVDTDLVFMTTHLQGTSTEFLPFNRGHENGAGNPPNPNGFRTAYLWESIWQPDSVLDIINHFLRRVDVLDENGRPTGKKKLIFPRYHQLDLVRNLVADARELGPGQSYLVEHSAGSGKSNTIAWLAHQLAGLHDEKDKRVFDTIIVITDRRVLDQQLRQTVKSFEQTRGLVSAIDKQKSSRLAEALEAGKDIIVTTLQTFPFVAEKLTAVKSKTFAVLIDEAHSSQTGETTRSLKRTLAAPSLEEASKEDEGPASDDEDEINARIEALMKNTGRLPNVSFFAFTATPKGKTLELFGTPQSDGSFRSFSLYPMRQAIEERFILDVLKNYTTFKVYFGLNKRIEDDPDYPRKKAIALLRSYADLHEHAIRTKTEIIVEHFETQVKNRIGKQAKAMVVTRSRLHAVRYKQMFDRVSKTLRLPWKALVAFSGTVKDPETGLEYTEAGMNGFSDSQTAEAFKQSGNRFLIVAEKFQTGFDQPLLHTMYVDKILSGVNAVQTLSRLNRIHPPDKEDTMVLDFANEAEDIQEAFQPYYEATLLTEPTDPNKLYDIKRTAEEFLIYQRQDVEAFAKVYFSKKGSQEKLRPILDPVVERFKEREKDEREEFRKAVTTFVRLYSFLSHVIRFKDPELEKTYQFLRILRALLPTVVERLPVDVTDKINMESYRIQETSTGEIRLLNEDGELEPIKDLGTGGTEEDEKIPLSEIVEYINENYGTDFTDEDKVQHFARDMERRLTDSEGLRHALDSSINPSRETRLLAFSDYFSEILEDMIDSNTAIYNRIQADPRFGELFREVMFRRVDQFMVMTGAANP